MSTEHSQHMPIDTANRSAQGFLDHVPASYNPWVEDPISGGSYRLLMVDSVEGAWVAEMRMPFQTMVGSHYHTGSVLGYTIDGVWGYPELDVESAKGGFVFERAGAVHSLRVTSPQGAHVLFHVRGSICYLSEAGEVQLIEDWLSVLSEYKKLAKDLEPELRIVGDPSPLT